MRNQDEMLKERESDFIDQFRAALERCHVNSHLRSRPLDVEWIDRDSLIVHLNDVESINEMDIRFLKNALDVQSYWTIAPLHLNRIRVSFQCQVGTRGR